MQRIQHESPAVAAVDAGAPTDEAEEMALDALSVTSNVPTYRSAINSHDDGCISLSGSHETAELAAASTLQPSRSFSPDSVTVAAIQPSSLDAVIHRTSDQDSTDIKGISRLEASPVAALFSLFY